MSRTLCLSLAVLFSGAFTRADDPQTPQPDRGERAREIVDEIVESVQHKLQPMQSPQGSMDSQIADCLLIQNQAEINLARFALKHVQDARVKQFAETMIRDHEDFGAKLARFAGHGDRFHNLNATTREHPRTTATEQTSQPALTVEGKRGNRIEVTAAKPISVSPVADDWFNLELAASENCQRMTKECLSKMKGDHFDHGYLGSQIGAHIAVLSKLEAADHYVSGELKDLLQDAQKTVKQHQARAEDLDRDLMHD